VVKVGSVVAVAWALLIGGREVYEYATTSPRFEVQHLIYEPSAHVDDDGLRELLAIEQGTNILACDLPELSERIAAHPWVAEATVTRNLPDTLEITVVEHTPEAIVLAERFYLVDGAGVPFKPVERNERGELPIITGIDRAQLASDRPAAVARINEALAVLSTYRAKQRPRLGELHLDDDGSITLYTAESGTQLRLGRSEFETRLERWDALRAALGDRADRLAVVHLDNESKPDRRDRVVARFANERDEAVLLAQAATELDSDQADPPSVADASAPARQPARPARRRNRIPRYE
jgi:cell division protein FtsQ